MAKSYTLTVDGVPQTYDERQEAIDDFNSYRDGGGTFEDAVTLVETKELGRLTHGVAVVSAPRKPRTRKAKA
jgi:hypothetical protein